MSRQLVDLHLPADHRQPRDPPGQRGAEGRLRRDVRDRDADGAKHGEDRESMVLNRLAPLHQHARCPRQAGAEVLVDAAEARHDVAKQENRDQQSRATQHRRIDGGTHQFLAQQVDLLLIGDETRQRFANGAGPLARAHCRDVERREALRQFLKRRGQGPAFEQSGANKFERASRPGTASFSVSVSMASTRVSPASSNATSSWLKETSGMRVVALRALHPGARDGDDLPARSMHLLPRVRFVQRIDRRR